MESVLKASKSKDRNISMKMKRNMFQKLFKTRKDWMIFIRLLLVNEIFKKKFTKTFPGNSNLGDRFVRENASCDAVDGRHDTGGEAEAHSARHEPDDDQRAQRFGGGSADSAHRRRSLGGVEEKW